MPQELLKTMPTSPCKIPPVLINMFLCAGNMQEH